MVGAHKRDGKGEVRSFRVPDEAEGLFLKDLLTDELFDIGTAEIQRLFDAEAVLLEGEAVSADRIASVGSQVEVTLPPGQIMRMTPAPLEGFSVVYEDDAVMVVCKPAGVGVTADRGRFELPFLGACLHHLMRDGVARPPRPRVVHRLDKETSGAVLIAKSREALRDLTAQFEERSVIKHYVALVFGVPHKSEGSIELPIGMDRAGKLRAGGKDARPAETHFSIAERFKAHCLLRVVPKTGRQHQIRVHLEAVGHPLVVDPVYGGSEALLLSTFKRKYVLNRSREERPLMSRLSLHAERITFRSPATGATVTAEAPYPKDLQVALRQLARWSPYRPR